MIKIKSKKMQMNKISNYCPNFVQQARCPLGNVTSRSMLCFSSFFVIYNYLAFRNIVVYVSLTYLRSHHQRPLDRPRSCLRPHPLSPPGNVYQGALAPDLSAAKRGKQYCK